MFQLTENKIAPPNPIPIVGTVSGYYSKNVPAHYKVMDEAVPYVMNALDEIIFNTKDQRPFQIADYGTADGGTSMPLMTKTIERIKEKYGKDQEIQIYYEDQATNDFSSLFKRVNGDQSYLKVYDDVFVSACGTSFYSQCFPSGSINLGFSATAMHFLYKRPCNLKRTLHHMKSKDEIERKLFFEEAKASWEKNLLLRAKEIVSGGHMVVCNLGVDAKGQFTGNTEGFQATQVWENMTNLWRGLVDDKIITEEEFAATTFNSYYWTEEEIVAPFKEKLSAVYQAGLRLVAVKTAIIPCPFNQAWLDSGYTADDKDACKAHAKKYMPSIRVWSQSTFISGLSDYRTHEEKKRIVDEFYSRYEEKIAVNPARYGHDYVHVYVHFKKS